MQVVWLKRDLRVRDHAPLVEAARRGPVVVLYVYEPRLWKEPEYDACHLNFVNESLAALDAALGPLGARVTYRCGPILSVLRDLSQALAAHGGISALRSHVEVGSAWTYGRDRAVHRWAKAQGVVWHEYGQDGVSRPHPSRDGWASRWTSEMAAPLYPVPKRVGGVDTVVPGWDHQRVRTPADLHMAPSTATTVQRGGLDEAEAVLLSFYRRRSQGYRSAMSSPLSAWDGCSRLSPYLAWGCVSTRDVWMRTRLKQRALRGRRDGKDWFDDLDAFESRLRWRGHFMQKLEDQPGLAVVNQASTVDGLREGRFHQGHFEAWCEGRTGLPLVDACMRSLRAERWLNFRMRAMLMSVSSYTLWNHWREPALHLARYFLDFEPGIHFPQVQMQSGTTGINSVRIYDPFKQARDHDPTGAFVRRWVPELADVSDAWIFEPHTKPGGIAGYPAPIVDVVHANRRARTTLESLRRTDEARAESQRIQRRHGSRKRRR
ncbi:MAG: deoxyribodipyrimidine photo-lyase/cryptochrome family protein [Myxococcota bacterium]